MAFDTGQKSFKELEEIFGLRTYPIVFWIGSGPSCEAGLPSWKELREILIGDFEEIGASIEDYAQKVEFNKRLEAAKRIQDHWVAFKILRELGESTFESSIRRAFRHADRVDPPRIYQKLPRLKLQKIITLNLDRLIEKAYSEANILPLYFSAQEISGFFPRFKELSPYSPIVVHLHGLIDNRSSWILCKDELARLKRDATYHQFVEHIFLSSVVVFLGISSDDYAVTECLPRLKERFDVGQHFWITNRQDVFGWAESQKIRIIRYRHHREVEELLDCLLAYVPQEDQDIPSVYAHQDRLAEPRSYEVLPPPEELVVKDLETIRRMLNQRAAQILQDERVVALRERCHREYGDFLAEYDEVIHRAWYVSTERGRNNFFGYQLVEEKAKGAFGRVFMAQGDDGGYYAVKVLRESIRNDNGLLHAFRRGVKAMKILQRHNLKGIVAYQNTWEIPASVVMEWVFGTNLKDAVEARYIDDWEKVIRVGIQLAEIIQRSHLLPERVLHRDIRPPNIILEEFYGGPGEDIKVRVLDFDLSWYQDAFEHSVMPEGHFGNYLAPEQTKAVSGVSSRNALVDSYGLGLTLLYMIRGKDPEPLEVQHRDWEQRVLADALNFAPCEWRSLPKRFARLIVNASRYDQSERLGMDQILKELKRLHRALIRPEGVGSFELMAEEIAARLDLRQYTWSMDRLQARINRSDGVVVLLVGNEREMKIELRIDWLSTGDRHRRKLIRKLESSARSACDILRSRGWIARFQAGGQMLNIGGSAQGPDLSSRLDRLSQGIEKALLKLPQY